MKSSLGVIPLLLCLSLAAVSLGEASTNCSSREIKELEALAVPLETPKILYRWGEGKYEKERIGKSFDVRHVNFSTMAGGKGLYLADTQLLTLNYSPLMEYLLVQILPKKIICNKKREEIIIPFQLVVTGSHFVISTIAMALNSSMWRFRLRFLGFTSQVAVTCLLIG
ncbi:MAG: hypothetical protein HQK52_20700 [Oligoflexia bacterium]|nr:hypothetical protein [Oligoflexia bacterium]